MSTQPLLIPQGVATQRSGRRIAIISSIAVALFAGALIGRATARTTSSLVAHPATLLSCRAACPRATQDARRCSGR